MINDEESRIVFIEDLRNMLCDLREKIFTEVLPGMQEPIISAKAIQLYHDTIIEILTLLQRNLHEKFVKDTKQN